MPTWCFKTAARTTRDSTVHLWYWQIDTQHALIAVTSPRLFTTIDDCIADARENGFRGKVEIPDGAELPATITCEEGDYVRRGVSLRSTAPSGEAPTR
jgi:hypothetical protein